MYSSSSSVPLGRRSAPPVLPLYKVTSNSKAIQGSRLSFFVNIALVVIPIVLVMLFISSIYMGTAFLEDHIQSKSDSSSFFSTGLPNTRNEIKKWSLEHLHGIDITSLGPPIVRGDANASFTNSAVYRKYTNASIYREMYEQNVKLNLAELFNRSQHLNVNNITYNAWNYMLDKAKLNHPIHLKQAL